jgi:hypothetical protein
MHFRKSGGRFLNLGGENPDMAFDPVAWEGVIIGARKLMSRLHVQLQRRTISVAPSVVASKTGDANTAWI